MGGTRKAQALLAGVSRDPGQGLPIPRALCPSSGESLHTHTHTPTPTPPWGELQPEGPQPSRGGGTRGSEAGSFWAPHPHASQSTPSYLPITQRLMPGPGANEQTELCLAGASLGRGARVVGTHRWEEIAGGQSSPDAEAGRGRLAAASPYTAW